MGNGKEKEKRKEVHLMRSITPMRIANLGYVPISILFVIMQKFYVEGITSGAAKG